MAGEVGVDRILRNCRKTLVFIPVGVLLLLFPSSSSSNTGIGNDEGSGEFKKALEQKCDSEVASLFPEDFLTDFGGSIAAL